MDQKQIEDIVHAVMHKLKAAGSENTRNAPGRATATGEARTPQEAVFEENALPDLGSDEIKTLIGVQQPNRKEVLEDLRHSTGTRIAGGRCGPRPRTIALLRFLADHSRSKDTVLKEIPSEWVAKTGLFEVHTEIADKDEYLTRPDKGRRLSKEAIDIILAKCKKNPQVQVVVSDGLLTDAITANFDEILPSLLKGLQNAGLDVGTPFFVRYGRVKLEDQVGELLGAKVVILLIGERPGLGQSESMSCYMVYSPTPAKTVESDRSCISNIHRAGTPPVEAAAVIVDLAKQMLQKQASGINLNHA